MLIGELSEKTGVSRDTIRYYEKMGLIEAQTARRDNNYKEYPPQSVDILKMIEVGKGLGFKLRETKEFLTYWKNNDTENEQLTQMVHAKIAEIDQKLQQLTELKARLQQSLVKC